MMDSGSLDVVQLVTVVGWAVVFAVWLACMARIFRQQFYQQAQDDWLESINDHKVMLVDPQNTVTAFTDCLSATWPYQVLQFTQAVGPVSGILLVILSFQLSTEGGTNVDGLNQLITEQLPRHLFGMVHGALVFVGSEILIRATLIRFGHEARKVAKTRGLFESTRNPYHELSKAAESVTQGLTVYQDVLDKSRKTIVSSTEKTAEMLAEACLAISEECSGVADAVRDVASQVHEMQPLLATLNGSAERLSQQTGKLQSQVAYLNPQEFAEAAGQISESGRRIEESNRETNRLLAEKVKGINESMDLAATSVVKELGSIIRRFEEMEELVDGMAETVANAKKTPLSDDLESKSDKEELDQYEEAFESGNWIKQKYKKWFPTS